MKVLRQRIEYKNHTFELPEGVDPESEEAEEIYNDFDWSDTEVSHAEENTYITN